MSENEDFNYIAKIDDTPRGVGPQLRAAREAKGLTIDQVAAETRISSRHIENIEANNFNDLPGKTYAIGFSRTLARTVGLNESDVVAMVREEIAHEQEGQRNAAVASGGTFEPGDPNRAPGGKLVWFSLFAVVILLVGVFFAARVLFADLPSLTEQEDLLAEEQAAAQQEQETAEATPAIDASSEVVFTAEGEVWVRFYDAQNRVLSERTLAEGDTYTIPSDAVGPRIITGRPDLLAITIGGQAVPKLSEELETLSDVEVSAQALLARNAPPPTPSADSTAGAAAE
ncbi:helix-turn-helix domain-containing protein [Erythrobacter alti]|uniref:helix-turn-helix domain-containing protein n=1 Tax=Erythrobacter alti TaxID=1896145 RepID=UPI0030F49163